ncbi:MAG: DUF1622 domain-containing protein [Elainella sp. Prado103]|nr:DUF1622 domain-containing protein [Elainella sp. Prado103]
MNWIEYLEGSLGEFVSFLGLTLEFISVGCVSIGLIKTIQLAATLKRHRYRHPFNLVRLRFGIWLALALEFQLGADILATTVAPSFEELGKLGLIAVIRTFLNYFLGKELELEFQIHEEGAALVTEGRKTRSS